MTTTSGRTALPEVEPVAPPAGGWQLMYDGDAHEPVNGARMEIESAIDGSVIASVPNADADDLVRAVVAARRAAADWARRSPAERANVLDGFVGALERAVERLAWLDTVNAGMPIVATRQEAATAGRIADAARLAAEIKGATFPQVNRLWGYSVREPYGVVGNILPFNHPVASAVIGLADPLAAGNSVIVKPSEHTCLSALEVGRIAQDTLPPGLVSVLSGDGPGIGNAICEHPDVPRIWFTGSVRTGRSVLRASAEHIKHVTLELGGKGPLAILPDVELDLAVEMAVGGMNFRGVQAGQSCQSTSRVLVHESMYDAFVAGLVDAVGRIRIGDPRDEATEMGSLAFREHRDRVRGYIDLGLAEGATLLAGGGTPAGLEGGFFVEPTVFGDVERTMRIANEEIFGPVVCVLRWSDEDELVELANSTEYGLTARVACGNVGPGLRLANAIDAGRMWVNVANGGPGRMPNAPHKHSGLGKIGDFETLLSYTREKAIVVAL